MSKNFGIMTLFCTVAGLGLILSIGSTRALSRSEGSRETIEAVADGTGVQLGKVFSVTLIISRFSTPADRQVLITAFQKDKNQGLVKALSKMKSVGHIAVTGTLGYDLSYIRLIPTPTGRTIRFITNRPLSFHEEADLTRSGQYNLTAGDVELNDEDMSKSKGVLYPLARLTMDQDNQVKFDLDTEPFTLTDIKDHRQQ